MENKLAAADAALKAGRNAEAIDHLMAAIDENPDQPAHVYRILLVQLYNAKRYADGEVWAAKGCKRHPRDFELWNTRGVLLRRADRHEDAIKALDMAARIDPKNLAPLVNKGNIYNDLRKGALAEPIFTQLVRREPRNAEYQRALGRAFMSQKKTDQAALRYRQALTLKKDYIDAWLDLSGLQSGRHNHDEGLAVLEEALAACPGAPKLLEAKAVILRRSSDLKAAETFMLSLLPQYPDAAWLHHQLAGAISDYDRPRANIHFARAIELEPDNIDYHLALAESYERSRNGDEGANLDLAHAELLKVLPILPSTPNAVKVGTEILIRLGDYEGADKLGTFSELGRKWVENGLHTALLKHLARVRAPGDRDELLRQHQMWGEAIERDVAKIPIKKKTGPRSSNKIRLGFMSSDLRGHPVAYFAQPLFEFLDNDRFEVYCYSWFQGSKADATQQYITDRVAGFRWHQDLGDRDAAQLIADDGLDMLLELGGTTHMNKLTVMAFKPAPLQGSWMGYPHSAGLKAIDHFVTDPQVLPLRPELLMEEPLIMPKTWIALGKLAFPEGHVINPVPPVKRNGFITFGTANNTYKYGPEVLAAWAEVMRAVPGSQFLFVRPEGGSEVFKGNIRRIFESHGVTADRVRFQPVRGRHIPFYNEIDISLDTFPLTGGTTTCETMWMGVPVVSLAGEAIYERQSYSLIHNAGLGDLVSTTLEGYIANGIRLANDVERIAELRAGLREQLKASPLGQTRKFAEDFYDLMARTVQAKLGVGQG